MDRITKSLLDEFVNQNGLELLSEETAFEHFTGYGISALINKATTSQKGQENDEKKIDNESKEDHFVLLWTLVLCVTILFTALAI